MKKLLFFTLAVGILMFLLVSTANAVALVSQERITAEEGTAQVDVMSCDAIITREDVGLVVSYKISDIWTPRSSAENRNITQTENAAPGDQLLSGSGQISNRRLRTLAEIGRAAPGICLASVENWSY